MFWTYLLVYHVCAASESENKGVNEMKTFSAALSKPPWAGSRKAGRYKLVFCNENSIS